MSVANPGSFKDITVGINNCTSQTCCQYGYGASVGWDPVTGLGTPNYLQILKYVSQLP